MCSEVTAGVCLVVIKVWREDNNTAYGMVETLSHHLQGCNDLPKQMQ